MNTPKSLLIANNFHMINGFGRFDLYDENNNIIFTINQNDKTYLCDYDKKDILNHSSYGVLYINNIL